jgi:hypothetical protein
MADENRFTTASSRRFSPESYVSISVPIIIETSTDASMRSFHFIRRMLECCSAAADGAWSFRRRVPTYPLNACTLVSEDDGGSH